MNASFPSSVRAAALAVVLAFSFVHPVHAAEGGGAPPSGQALAFGGPGLVTASQNLRRLSGGAAVFSETEPVHPVSGYTGPALHGGAFVSGGAVIDQWNVFNDDPNGDSLRFRVAAPPQNARGAALFVWKRENFDIPYAATVPVNLATADASLSYTGRRFGTAVGSDLRFVVRDAAGGWFVTPSLGQIPTNFATVTLPDPSAAAWRFYDPFTDAIGAAAAPDLSSVLAAGARLEVTKTGTDGGAITAALSGFTVMSGSSLPVITSPSHAFGVIGRPFNFATTATNGPGGFEFGPLPAGLVADAATGVVSGVPAATGLTEVSVQASNPSGAGPAVTVTFSVSEPSEADIPLAGLVANFEFSGNANDLAANRGGVVHGATPAPDRFGRPDRAYAYNGTTDHIEVADHDDFSVSTTGELSLSVWMRPDALVFPQQEGSGYVHWLGKGGAGQHEWTFRMYGLGNSEDRENRTSFYLFNAAGGQGAGSYVQEPVVPGEWIHYVAVVSVAADRITWYKNGLQRDRDPFFDSIYNVVPANGSAPLHIGTRDLASRFLGAIDDLRIYNRVLDVAEIQQLYQEQPGQVPSNQAPVDIALSNAALPWADAQPGATVGILSTVDPDAADTHVYSLQEAGPFAIAGDALVVGPGGVAAGSHPVLVRTTDAGGLFHEREFLVVVTPATPGVVWPDPAPIVYGTSLSTTQLNAAATGVGGAGVAGTFTYVPETGSILGAGVDQVLSVTFTPTGEDATNYGETTATARLTVFKAVPSILWPAPSAVVHGTPLSGAQLNASAVGVGGTPVAGAFVYAPDHGTVLDAGAGQVLTVGFTPTGADALNYTPASGAASITVQPAPALLALSGLRQFYDGTPRVVTVATEPVGLVVSVAYAGGAVPPVWPGTYPVVATLADPNHEGAAEGTLVVTTTARVRQGGALNGGLDGSLQVLTPANVTLNSTAWLAGDLLVPGTPVLQLNGQPAFAGIVDADGDPAPAAHRITLNSGSVLRHLVRRVDPAPLASVAAPPPPAGTRNVTLNSAGQSPGDFATLRNLTLNGGAGSVAVPPGTYGAFTANGGGTFVLGVPEGAVPAVYHFQQLTLNGGAGLAVVGPVVIVTGGGVVFNQGQAGSPDQPDWLELRVASGGVTLNSGASLHGHVHAPAGTVTINSGARLHGSVAADRLHLNGTGQLVESAP